MNERHYWWVLESATSRRRCVGSGSNPQPNTTRFHTCFWNKSTNCAWAGAVFSLPWRKSFHVERKQGEWWEEKDSDCLLGSLGWHYGGNKHPHQTWRLVLSPCPIWQPLLLHNQCWRKKNLWGHLRFSPEIPVAILGTGRCWGLNIIVTHTLTGQTSARPRVLSPRHLLSATSNTPKPSPNEWTGCW